ncbi:MAG: hypothetical protein WBG32_15550 [Nodosilinea sp.]
MAQNCNQLLQAGFSHTDEQADDTDFVDLCTQKAKEYETAQSIELQTASCETDIKLAKNEQFTSCALQYEIVMADGSLLQETYLWQQLDVSQYQFLEVTWKEA